MLIGILLKESLRDLQVLQLVHVTKTEVWQVNNAAPYQPSVWTALTFEAPDDQADEIAEQFSRALNPRGWFIDASTAVDMYVVFPGKVFRYRKGDAAQREAAREYGRSLGVPESQLDWRE